MHYFVSSLVSLLLLASVALAADLPDPEKLPAHKELPDPLVMFDGTRVRTADDWVNKRRPELKRLFQHYMYGSFPAVTEVKADIEREDAKALRGQGDSPRDQPYPGSRSRAEDPLAARDPRRT